MKSLFNATDNAELIVRINRLTAGRKPEWGRMNVAQMLAHSQAPLKVAFGESKVKRSFVGMLFGRIAKKKLSRDEPWQHGMPTDKSFIMLDKHDFEEEKKKLIALVERFAQSGPAGISNEMHPFFGKLKTEEWDKLMWNHLNHHLKQFGL
jgi:hypothetical protein